jgi:hypothetical protein
MHLQWIKEYAVMHMDTPQFIRVVSIRSALIEIVANKKNTEPQSRYSRRGRDRMRHRKCLSPLKLWVETPFMGGVLDTTLCNKVWLATGRWFSTFSDGEEVSANKKNTEPQSRYTNRHNDFKTKRSKDRTTHKIEKTDILPTTSLWIKSYKWS